MMMMMNSTLIGLLQRTPGFRALAVRVHPVWFFRLTRLSMTLSSWFWPRTIRRRRIFREVLKSNFNNKELRLRGQRYLFYARLFKDIEIAWNNWQSRHRDWIIIDGESHLQSALKQGKGVVLVSAHNYGFSKLVAPVLAQRGYRIHRGGNGGTKAVTKRSRWGTQDQLSWGYLNYKGDYWHRVQLLKAIQAALAANDIVHVSPRGYRKGEEETAIEFFGRKYFLDANWFRVFQICQAPVLPCFAVGHADRQIKIVIHPALGSGQTTAKDFATIQSDYITKFPEYGRLWKSVYINRGKW